MADLERRRRFEMRAEIGGVEQIFLLLPGANRLGSLAARNEVVLPLPGVSKRHAVVTVAIGGGEDGGGGLTLRDLGSKNGTFVNGVRIAETRLGAEDEVRVGGVVLRIVETLAPAADLDLALSFEASTSIGGIGSVGGTGWLETDPAPSRHGLRGAPADAGLSFPEGHVPGRSAAMAALYAEMRAVAATGIPALLTGETGTGKEALARALHLSSPRREAPFVAVNCAAIPADLLEAEMFGIGKGVATGVLERTGKIAQARGGTLFLDEIGDMPAALQPKLLRALQEKEVAPVGGSPFPLDVRIVAATHGDLKRSLAEGRFRADLFYRLAGIVLEVPPLRRRRDDLPLLIETFVRTFARQAGKRVRGMTARALERLLAHGWPGNVRELEHEIRRLAVLCPDGQPIDLPHLSPALRDPAPEGADPIDTEGSLRLEEHVERLERRLILAALERAEGNRTQAARLLGISRNGLALKMERLGIGGMGGMGGGEPAP